MCGTYRPQSSSGKSQKTVVGDSSPAKRDTFLGVRGSMSAKNYRSRSTGRSGSKSTNRSKKFNDNENRKRVRTESPSPRRNQGKRAKTAEGTDGSSGRTQKTVLLPKLILVLDTNILLERSGLQFLEEIAAGKYDAADLPPIQIFIPHVVLLELDRQKTRHFNGLDVKASAAIRFLHEQIIDHHNLPPSSKLSRSTDGPTGSEPSVGQVPRFIGQTAKEFADASLEYLQEVDDDHILFCCLQLQARRLAEAPPQSGQAGKRNRPPVIWCVTNDRNLRIRTVINGVPAFSLENVLQNIQKKLRREASLFDSL